MKAFRIKKRKEKISVFIPPSVLYFTKPKLPFKFFKNVHKPIQNQFKFKYEIVQEKNKTIDLYENYSALDVKDPLINLWLANIQGDETKVKDIFNQIVEMNNAPKS